MVYFIFRRLASKLSFLQVLLNNSNSMHLYPIYRKNCGEKLFWFFIFIFSCFIYFLTAGFQKLSICSFVKFVLFIYKRLRFFTQSLRNLHLIFIYVLVYVQFKTFSFRIFNVCSIFQKQNMKRLELLLFIIRNLSWVIRTLIHYVC